MLCNPEEELRMTWVGLVGCGNWGKNILRDLLALGCEVLVADIDVAARSRALGHGASAVVPEATSLPPCDGYVVAVPIPQLADVCASLLPLGRPVFSEKTLCLSRESGEKLASLGGHERLFAMHKWRYHPGVEALRLAACSGRLGKLQEIRLTRHAWVLDLHGGDVFWTLAAHDLTIVKHLLGYIPHPAKAWSRLEGSVPVSLLAVLQDDGIRVTLSTCARHCVRESGVSIHGSHAAAAMPDPYLPQIVIQSDAGREQIPIETTFPLFLELGEFVEHLRGGVPPRCSLAEAIEVTEALLGLRSSAGV